MIVDWELTASVIKRAAESKQVRNKDAPVNGQVVIWRPEHITAGDKPMEQHHSIVASATCSIVERVGLDSLQCWWPPVSDRPRA
jgi:hypothetical protein